MKKEFAILLLLLLSCTREEPFEQAEKQKYRDVSIDIIADNPDGTRSVVSEGVESFRRAILFAFDADSGDILTYGESAGDNAGKPVVRETSEARFTWALPLDTEMNIYAIVNYPSDFPYSQEDDYLAEEYLETLDYYCGNASTLRSLETGGTGLPMTGIVSAYTMSSKSEPLSITVKNLFAKYEIELRKDGLPEGTGVTVTSLKVLKGNCRVPYFGSGYAQTSASYLRDFDYATARDLEALGKGSSANIYVMENCQGLRAGAQGWDSVREDLSSWSGLQYCTLLLLEYRLELPGKSPAPFSRRIYLGSGDMKTDFNVMRNKFKKIIVHLSDDVNPPDPYFRFTGDNVIKAEPGETVTISYNSNLYSRHGVTPSFTFSGDNASSLVSVSSHNPSARTVSIKFSATCEDGAEYTIQGGAAQPVYVSELGKYLEATDNVKVLVRESYTLEFEKDYTNAVSYYNAPYVTRRNLTLEKAQKYLQTLSLEEASANIAAGNTMFKIVQGEEDCKIGVDIYPVQSGAAYFKLGYGDGKSTGRISFEVTDPVIDTGGRIRVSVDGEYTAFSTHIKDFEGNNLGWPELRGNRFNMEIAPRDPYGTDLSVEHESGTSWKAAIKGFGGLPGFGTSNYTFDGLEIPATCTLSIPGGASYSANLTVEVMNPLEGYGIDGTVHEFEVHQGRRSQVGSTGILNDASYYPEYMTDWPQRTFSIDVSQGAGRDLSITPEMWTVNSPYLSLDKFSYYRGILHVEEDMASCGALYLGKRIRNAFSGEQKDFVHSIIRVYNHYSVFASFDVKECMYASYSWSDLSSISWDVGFFNGLPCGCFVASPKHCFDKAGVMQDALLSMIEKDIDENTRVTVLPGFGSWPQGWVQMGWDPVFPGERQYARMYGVLSPEGGGRDYVTYIIGYYNNSGSSYSIVYGSVDYCNWSTVMGTPFNWRYIAAANKPWFKVGAGDTVVGDKYITRVAKSADGEYNFNIIPSASASDSDSYADPEGKGYIYINLFWEGREGRSTVQTKRLSPLSRMSTNLTIVNGWLDPVSCTGGVPILKDRVGMYFFPERTDSPVRNTYPGYYSNDNPYAQENGTINGSEAIVNNFDCDFLFGGLLQRDLAAER